ncbi:MAG TPA: tetratricopeptide repeat protein [Polyangiales bacterium]|nr:tetratricopeptide repeat protein [Polyangiales bacterium]
MRTPTPWSWKRSVAHGTALGLLLIALPRASAQSEPQPQPRAGATDDKAKPKKQEADRRARELFEQGRAAFSEGQYRDAWENFREAYILSKRPELLYNVGQSADRMRMDRDALAAFKLYLEKLPNAANRREVESRIAYLEDRLAREGDTELNPTTLDDSTDGQGSSELELDPESSDSEGRPAAPETLSDGEGEQDGEDDSSSMPADGQPERSGWYVRLAVGLGVLADGLSDSAADSLGSSTLSLLLGVGYAINDGVVIGGGVTFDGGLSPSVSIDEGSRDIETANLGMIIAFVDYYLAPRKHGWHLLGGLGVGQLSLSDTTASVGVEDAAGGSLLLGGGCEWPLDRDWALGALLRVTLSHLSTDTAQHNAISPSIAFTGTWY